MEFSSPIATTLSGYSPTGNPLMYVVSDEPLNGSLTGTPPTLTYTPAATFAGLDEFEFTVSDGVNTSLPALVTIIVKGIPRNYMPLLLR